MSETMDYVVSSPAGNVVVEVSKTPEKPGNLPMTYAERYKKILDETKQSK